jgi:lipopolysaccharide/colanic/teichoic acid biosynthesis glycosyltransferase
MNTKRLHCASLHSILRTEAALRRVFDIGCASAALLLLAPAMLMIAAAIWVETGRPIFFSQVRLGRNGRRFLMHKFRKFHPTCGVDTAPLTLKGDNRLTEVGRILAETKADELPQFWNVFKGDMSIVGPRPESLAFVDCFSNGFERVLDYTPGLLGPSQILFRHEQRFYPKNVDPAEFYRRFLFPAKARIDLDYFARRSFLGDLGWIVRGVLAVVGLASSAEPIPSGMEFTQEPRKPDGGTS